MDIQRCKRLTNVIQMCLASLGEISHLEKPDEYDELSKTLSLAIELARKYMN